MIYSRKALLGLVIFTVLFFTVLFGALLLDFSAISDVQAITAPAKIAYLEGSVLVKRQNSARPTKAEVGASLFFGDSVITKQRSRCQVNMAASGILRLAANTEINFPMDENTGDKVNVVRVKQGKSWSNINALAKDEVFEVKTPSLVAAIQGTKFVVTYDPNTGISTIGVGSGQVKAITKDIEKLIATAKQISVDKKGKVTAIIDIDPKKLQQDFIDKDFQGATEADQLLMTATSPVDGSEVSKKSLPIEGNVGSDVRQIEVEVRSASNNNKKDFRKKRIRVRNGAFKGTIDLFNGENIIQIMARNKEGKKATRTFKVVYDKGNALNLTLDSPATGSEFATDKIPVSGTISDPTAVVTVLLNGTEVAKFQKSDDGKFKTNVTLVEGKNFIEVKATAGRQSTAAQAEIKYVPRVENVEIILTSPLNNLEVDGDSVDFQGRVNDARVTEITVKAGTKTIKHQIKDGQFRGTLTIAPGRTTITISATNPEGRSATVERTVIRKTFNDSSISIFSPVPALTYGDDDVEVNGRIADSSVTSVDIFINGRKVATLPVHNGTYSGKIKLIADGDNQLEVVVTVNGQTYRKSITVKKTKGASNSGGIEITPVSPTLIYEAGNSKGNFVLAGTIVADPPVTEVVTYLDSRRYSRTRVDNNQFKIQIQLTDVINQVRVVPVWKDVEFSGAAAIYKDQKSPTINIILPIVNTRYNSNTVNIKPNIIKIEGVVTDELLRQIQFKRNLDTPKTITYTGVNIVNFSHPVQLYEGQNTLYIIAQDYFGNNIQKSVVVYYEAQQFSTVKGGLTNKYTGAPVSGALVQLIPTGGQAVSGQLQAVTRSDGSYSLPSVPTGPYVLIIARDHYLPYQKQINVQGTVTTVSDSLDKLQ